MDLISSTRMSRAGVKLSYHTRGFEYMPLWTAGDSPPAVRLQIVATIIMGIEGRIRRESSCYDKAYEPFMIIWDLVCVYPQSIFGNQTGSGRPAQLG